MQAPTRYKVYHSGYKKGQPGAYTKVPDGE